MIRLTDAKNCKNTIKISTTRAALIISAGNHWVYPSAAGSTCYMWYPNIF